MVAWTAIGALFALPYILRGASNSAYATIINWWLVGAFVPLIVRADRRLSTLGARPPRMLAAHIACAVALTALYVAVAATLEYRIGLNPWNPLSNVGGLVDWFLWALVMYCVILGTLKALQYYRRHVTEAVALERMERRFLETRLNSLRLQLEPRFLFDVLASISAHVEDEPRVARRMIEHLGDLLRFSLATRDRQEVTLAEEMSFLEHYLALHRLRLNNRLTVTLSIMPEVEQTPIPALLLQPLLENAIRHGIGGRAEGGSVAVAARQVGSRVEIRVSDDGVGLPPGWRLDSLPGQGVSLTRERLLARYPSGECDFTLGARAGGGTEVKITLPLATTNEESPAHAIA